MERLDIVLLEKARMMLRYATDFSPEKFFQIRFRRRSPSIDLALIKAFIKPDSDPGRCVGLAGGVG